MTSYELSRQFWNWAFENPEKVKPIHCAIYFFAMEHCNRLGWKSQFGMPTSMAIEAIGVKSYRAFKNAFDDLINWGLIVLIERSKNQYSSNIIALSLKYKAKYKALDKALQTHGTNHSQYIKTNKPITSNQLSNKNSQIKNTPDAIKSQLKTITK
jgi:hypothetical protein